jgi:hypothetical protein
LFDANSGIDISGGRPGIRLLRMIDLFPIDDERRDSFISFTRALDDYVDSNDLRRPNGGVEMEEYSALKRYPLPRNHPMLFKWEVCWVPGCAEFFKADAFGRMPEFRVIAPRGLRSLRGRANFFSASRSELKAFAKLSDADVAAAIEARNAWKRERTPLSTNLPLGLLGRLRQHFSFRESGCYTLLIKAPVGEFGGWRILSLTLRVGKYLSTGKNIMYYDWRFTR